MVPWRELLPEPAATDGPIRVRADGAADAIERAAGGCARGGRVPGSWERAVAALLQAARVQLQERAVHLR